MALRQRRGTKSKHPSYRLCTLFNSLILLCIVTICIWTFIVKAHQNVIISSNESNILLKDSNLYHSHKNESHSNNELNKKPKEASSSSSLSSISNQNLWLNKVKDKINCIKRGYGDIFMYHMRKAAGTTLREVLTIQSKKNNVLFLELEGLTLPPQYILNNNNNNNNNNIKGLLTALSLRHPIERIQSLYWYEHVAWWIEVRHLKNKCKTFEAWVEHWNDNNVHKQSFSQINPYNNYVEISNYYVKSLIGWKNTYEKITEKELSKAIDVLNNYDFILISDWLKNSSSHVNQEIMWENLLPGSKIALKQQLVKVNPQLKSQNKHNLMSSSSLPKVMNKLYEMNEYDLKLWEYALELATRRYDTWLMQINVNGDVDKKNLRGIENQINENFCLGSSSSSSNRSSSSGNNNNMRRRRKGNGCRGEEFEELKKKWTGLHQPRGHKE